jgi:hypothetical protein
MTSTAANSSSSFDLSNSPAVSERGGRFSGPGQMSKNYMNYLSGGSYDDDSYALYAPSDYSTQEQMPFAAGMPDSLRMHAPDDSNSSPSNRGFQVLGNNTSNPNPQPQQQTQSKSSENYQPQQPQLQRPSANYTRQPPFQNQNLQNQTRDGFDQSNYFSCVKCGYLASQTCGCPYRDSVCPNGHSWYMAGGKMQLGLPPNH